MLHGGRKTQIVAPSDKHTDVCTQRLPVASRLPAEQYNTVATEQCIPV